MTKRDKPMYLQYWLYNHVLFTWICLHWTFLLFFFMACFLIMIVILHILLHTKVSTDAWCWYQDPIQRFEPLFTMKSICRYECDLNIKRKQPSTTLHLVKSWSHCFSNCCCYQLQSFNRGSSHSVHVALLNLFLPLSAIGLSSSSSSS